MPSRRDTRRSGWKASRSSRRSPLPTNAMGTPTTDTTDSAAPPRASPSSLLSTTAVTPMRRLNSPALLMASCPVMASATYSRSDGSTASWIAASSSISSLSTCSRPAVSTITVSNPRLRASVTAPRARATGSRLARRVVHPERGLRPRAPSAARSPPAAGRRSTPAARAGPAAAASTPVWPPSWSCRIPADRAAGSPADDRARRREPLPRVAEQGHQLVAHDPDRPAAPASGFAAPPDRARDRGPGRQTP